MCFLLRCEIILMNERTNVQLFPGMIACVSSAAPKDELKARRSPHHHQKVYFLTAIKTSLKSFFTDSGSPSFVFASLMSL
jgi:hypothetical protein